LGLSVSFKDLNKPLLAVVLAANAIAFYGLSSIEVVSVEGVRALVSNWSDLAPPAIVVVVAGILNAQLSSLAKARIVFGKWDNPLPGSDAYTLHGPADPRVDMTRLAECHGPLPTARSDQNSHWYRLYRSVSEDHSVSQVHREYLFTRDYAICALIVLPFGIAGGFLLFAALQVAWIWAAALLVQFVLVRRAAKHHGIRMVQTVCALKAAGK
jgi:hypothetical protein